MQRAAGTYVIRISPKSGNPVFGQTDVNSGQLMAISYSRSGRGFGKVSIVGLDIAKILQLLALRTFDTGEKGELGYGVFRAKTAGLAARATTSAVGISRASSEGDRDG